MKKYIFFSICFTVFSVTSYSQKKGKIALPKIEKRANNYPWQNIKTKKIYWLETIDKKEIASIMETSTEISTAKKQFKINK